MDNDYVPASKRDRPPSSCFDTDDSNYRSPFKNLSNFVLPSMKKKLSSSTKNFTRSMSQVAKTSQNFFHYKGKEDREDEFEEDVGNDTAETVEVDEADSTLNDDFSAATEDFTNNTTADFSASFPFNVSPVQPKKALRRIHSMYQTTKEKESCVMEDNSHLKNTTIQVFSSSNDLIPRIGEDTMYDILSGAHSADFDEFLIIDCRFDYEFKGGHLDGAVNISTKDGLERRFFNHTQNPFDTSKKRMVIFHCEFSIFRGPTMASHFRKIDRTLNSDRYPTLSFPDIVILEGGYKGFFTKYKHMCSPQGYVEMKDVHHEQNCESQMSKIRQDSKLTRAKSFNQFAATNDFPLSPYGSHNRSHSFTTITSEKILKRQKSIPKVKTVSMPRLEAKLVRASTFSNDQSIFNSSYSSSPIYSQFNHSSISSLSGTGAEDLQPPSASFQGHRKSYSTANYSSSSTSINSSSSSLYSESTCSSSEGLTAPYSSPLGEFTEYFDTKTTISTNKPATNPTATVSVLKPISRKPSGPLPALPSRSTSLFSPNISSQSFKFPNNLKPKTSRQGLNRITTASTQKVNSAAPLLNSSPIISSPLSTATPVSTIDSTLSNQASSLIDPINDTPVDFSVPFATKSTRYVNHTRKVSGSLLSSAGGGLYNFISLDIDEAGEQEDEEYTNSYYSRRGSLATTVDSRRGSLATNVVDENDRIPTYFQKSPFN